MHEGKKIRHRALCYISMMMSPAITVTHERGAPREHDARSACVSECLKVSYVGTPQQSSALHTVRGPSEVIGCAHQGDTAGIKVTAV